jgi:hypothetical protein
MVLAETAALSQAGIRLAPECVVHPALSHKQANNRQQWLLAVISCYVLEFTKCLAGLGIFSRTGDGITVSTGNKVS